MAKPELLRANRAALDDLPRRGLKWRWVEIVDCGDGGLDPSLAERLAAEGLLKRDAETGLWTVSDTLWRYIEEADWLDTTGAARGQSTIDRHGIEVPRAPVERAETIADGGRDRERSRQVTIDLQDDAEDAVRERRSRRVGPLQKKLAAEKAVEAMPKWELAALDPEQATLTRYAGPRVGRLKRPAGRAYA